MIWSARSGQLIPINIQSRCLHPVAGWARGGRIMNDRLDIVLFRAALASNHCMPRPGLLQNEISEGSLPKWRRLAWLVYQMLVYLRYPRKPPSLYFRIQSTNARGFVSYRMKYTHEVNREQLILSKSRAKPKKNFQKGERWKSQSWSYHRKTTRTVC